MSSAAPPGPRRSQAVATWLALLGGGLGLHRFYLHGARDVWAWLHPWPTAVGAYGLWRMREFGVDDERGGMLVPFLGIMLAATMLQAIVYGLTPDERWAERHAGAGGAVRQPWTTFLAVALALALGAAAAITTISFTAQRYLAPRAELR